MLAVCENCCTVLGCREKNNNVNSRLISSEVFIHMYKSLVAYFLKLVLFLCASKLGEI